MKLKNLILVGLMALLSVPVVAQNTTIYLPRRGDLLSASGPITLQVGATNAAGVTNLTGQAHILLPPKASISFFPYLGGAGAATVSNVTIQLAVSPWYTTNSGAYTTNLVVNAGTSLFTTTSNSVLQITTTLNGTSAVLDSKSLNFTNWDGALALEILSISNFATNATPPVLSNLWYSFQAPQY